MSIGENKEHVMSDKHMINAESQKLDTQVPEQPVSEDDRPASRKLDQSEIEDIAAGDQPIELPEI